MSSAKACGRQCPVAVEETIEAEYAEHVNQGAHRCRAGLKPGGCAVVAFAVEHHDARRALHVILPAGCLLMPRLQGVEAHGEVMDGKGQGVLQVVSMIHQCHPRLIVHLEPKLSVECSNHVCQMAHDVRAFGLTVGSEIRVGKFVDGRIVHDFGAAICQKLVVAQCLVDWQQGKVCDRCGGEVSVVAAVQSTVDACLEDGVCGLGTGSVHGVSNL